MFIEPLAWKSSLKFKSALASDRALALPRKLAPATAHETLGPHPGHFRRRSGVKAPIEVTMAKVESAHHQNEWRGQSRVLLLYTLSQVLRHARGTV